MKRKRVVVLSGAGISAESGLKTFRDSEGLWEGYKVTDVATPEAWRRDPGLVLEFYNERRKDVKEAAPNAAHLALVKLEAQFDVSIVTQNIDDLHERAGSREVLHLHGEIFKSRSSIDESLVYALDGLEISLGEKCGKGSQLRPHIVWFGEAVPLMETAIEIVRMAEIFIVVGTSLVVYPAAGLLDFVPAKAQIYLVDPHIPAVAGGMKISAIAEKASIGLPKVVEMLLDK